jgi:hypothetical protein
MEYFTVNSLVINMFYVIAVLLHYKITKQINRPKDYRLKMFALKLITIFNSEVMKKNLQFTCFNAM